MKDQWIVVLAVGVGLLLPAGARAQSTQESSKDDAIKSIIDRELEPAPGGYTYNPQGRRDPFVSLMKPVGADTGPKTRKPGMEGFAVKVAIREGNNAEYFWITPFTPKDGQFSGAINNTPRQVHSVKLGQTITFDQSEIVDWLYMDGDKMKGNYTACALLKSASKREVEEFKKRFGLDCDF